MFTPPPNLWVSCLDVPSTSTSKPILEYIALLPHPCGALQKGTVHLCCANIDPFRREHLEVPQANK